MPKRIDIGFFVMTVPFLLQMGPASAAPKLPTVLQKRVEAEPGKPYWLMETHGPWMILAASFAGDTAEQEAHQLAIELRSKFGLKAYRHKKRYDFSRPVRGKGINRFGEPKTMRHRHDSSFDEVAVLIGDFETVDDPALQKTLGRVKYARPDCLQLNRDEPTSLRFAGLRAVQKKLNRDESKQQKGPMGTAFVTRNPLLPREFFVPQGIDSLVMSMNKGVKYSLLDCPGKYTVRVATFRGNVILDQREIRDIEEKNRKMTSKLASAAEKAHELTMALRDQRVEAYEFHDRHESIVTVGNFGWVKVPRKDGKEELNPAVYYIMQAYGPRKRRLPGTAGRTLAGLQPRSLNGIAFDIQPLPVLVPRRSIATDYAQSGRR